MPGFGEIDPRYAATIVVTFIIAITVHEFMHAWTAAQLGDDTARFLGRISLNPVVHFDPVGALMFLFIAMGLPGIAWGKPVPVNDSRLRPLGRFGRQGSMAVVALAGPFSNIVLGALAAAMLQVARFTGNSLGVGEQFLWIFMLVNFSLAAFNMIPLPPLDGSRILTAVLPGFWRPILAPLERYGILILFLLLVFGRGIGSSILSAIIDPVRDLLLRIFASGL